MLGFVEDSLLTDQLLNIRLQTTMMKCVAFITVTLLTGFFVSLSFGPLYILWLRKRFCERIDSSSPTLNRLHAGKSGTPTMGGLLIISAFLVGTVAVAYTTIVRSFELAVVQAATFVGVSFMLVGAFDDYTKLSTKKKGLKAKQKFVLQCVLGGIAAWWLRSTETEILIPFTEHTLSLGWWTIPWSTLVIVATSNAVNLTDGLDGLATGCSITVTSAIAVMAVLAVFGFPGVMREAPKLLVTKESALCVAGMAFTLTGALLGFLYFNCHPAQVFMGDTGALPIGAIIGVLALGIHADLWLLVIGAVLVVETLSVIVQLSCYRIFGRRPLRCSPLHNHFVFEEVPETRIVTRFWIASAFFAYFGVMTYFFG